MSHSFAWMEYNNRAYYTDSLQWMNPSVKLWHWATLKDLWGELFCEEAISILEEQGRDTRAQMTQTYLSGSTQMVHRFLNTTLLENDKILDKNTSAVYVSNLKRHFELLSLR